MADTEDQSRPEPVLEASKSPSTKRPRSPSPAPAPKRPRLSDGSVDSPSTVRASPSAPDAVKTEPKQEVPDPLLEKRKNSVQEEKKRGQRLFGGLLSTLSRSTPDGAQKRRAEIESRQAAKAKQQAIDNKAREAEKLAKLKESRRKEQIKFDEQVMHTRHSNMLAMANFLYTKTQPKLYYKPWELLPDDEDHIKLQIAEAKACVEQEVDDFYNRHPQLNRPVKAEPDEPVTEGEGNANDMSKETEGEPEAESPSVSNALVDTTNPPAQAQTTAERESIEEHNGEVVVEAEEDTVIY